VQSAASRRSDNPHGHRFGRVNSIRSEITASLPATCVGMRYDSHQATGTVLPAVTCQSNRRSTHHKARNLLAMEARVNTLGQVRCHGHERVGHVGIGYRVLKCRLRPAQAGVKSPGWALVVRARQAVPWSQLDEVKGG